MQRSKARRVLLTGVALSVVATQVACDTEQDINAQNQRLALRRTESALVVSVYMCPSATRLTQLTLSRLKPGGIDAEAKLGPWPIPRSPASGVVEVKIPITQDLPPEADLDVLATAGRYSAFLRKRLADVTGPPGLVSVSHGMFGRSNVAVRTFESKNTRACSNN